MKIVAEGGWGWMKVAKGHGRKLREKEDRSGYIKTDMQGKWRSESKEW